MSKIKSIFKEGFNKYPSEKDAKILNKTQFNFKI